MVKIKTTPRKQPKQQRAQATVEALLTAAAHILVREGYEKASTNRIAERAGISVGSLYQYFPSKEAIVAELVEQMLKEALSTLEGALESFGDAPMRQAVRELLTAMFRIHADNPKLRRIIIEQVPRVGRLEKMLDLETQVAEVIRTHLEKRRSEIRKVDAAMASFILVHAIQAVIHSAVFKKPEYLKSERFVDELTELVMRYLAVD